MFAGLFIYDLKREKIILKKSQTCSGYYVYDVDLSLSEGDSLVHQDYHH